MADPQVPGYTAIANSEGAFQGQAQTPGTQDQETLVPSGASGSPVTSVFGRPGPVITAQQSDYSAFYDALGAAAAVNAKLLYQFMGAPSTSPATNSANFTAALVACGATITGSTGAFVATGGQGVIGLGLAGVLGIPAYQFDENIPFIDGDGIGVVGPGGALCEITTTTGFGGTAPTTSGTAPFYVPNNQAVFGFRNSTWPGQGASTGVPISGFTINGTNAGNYATGFQFGDRFGNHIYDVTVNSFSGTSSVGYDFLNQHGYSERNHVDIIANGNATSFRHGATVANGISWEYSTWVMTGTTPPNGNGWDWFTTAQNYGQSFTGGHVTCRGNFTGGTGSNTGFGFLLGPLTKGLYNWDIQVETDGASGLVGHTTFNVTAGCAITYFGQQRFAKGGGVFWQVGNQSSVIPTPMLGSGPLYTNNDPDAVPAARGPVHVFQGQWSETSGTIAGNGVMYLTTENQTQINLQSGSNNNPTFNNQRTDSGCSFSPASSTILDPNIQSTDNASLVQGVGVEGFVTAVTVGVGFVLSSTPHTSTPINPTITGSVITVGLLSVLGQASRYVVYIRQPLTGNPGTLSSVPWTWVGGPPTLQTANGAIDVAVVHTPDGLNFYGNLLPAPISQQIVHPPAQISSTANNASMAGLQTLDGYTTVVGDRILLTGQTTTSQNGLWLAQTGAWTRPSDFASGSVQPGGTLISVSGGTNRQNTRWQLLGDGTVGTGSITVDTSAQTWDSTTVPGVGRTGYKNTSTTITPGVSGAQGAVVTLGPDAGFFGILPTILTWTPNGVSGETITFQITVTYENATTGNFTTAALGGTTGTAAATPLQMLQLFKDGHTVVSVGLSAASNNATTTATPVFELVGQNIS